MVGVSSRMLARSPARGWTFLSFYTAGTALTTLVLATLLTALSRAIQRDVEGRLRLAMFLSLSTAFLVADIAGRTPSLRRQTPQGLIRVLNPAALGLVYGADVSLLVTTIRVSSLMWIAISYAILQNHLAVPYVIVSYSVAGMILLTVISSTRPLAKWHARQAPRLLTGAVGNARNMGAVVGAAAVALYSIGLI